MSYKAMLVWSDDLTDDELENQPDNGCGKDDARYIKIEHGGEVVGIYSDAMEPEDTTFYRDLEWITTELEQAYQLGFEAALNQ